jgi:hypothetical protein
MICILRHVRISSYDGSFIIPISLTTGRRYEAVEFAGQFYFLKSWLGLGAVDGTHLARTGKRAGSSERTPWTRVLEKLTDPRTRNSSHFWNTKSNYLLLYSV